MTLDDYLRLFKDAKPGQRVGEAITWYLYSTSAAREIKEFSPDAQIVVMLRNPVDVMYAQHNQLIFNVIEDIPDFAEALAAEPDRRAGKRLPPGPINVENLFYRHSVHFAEQLERYFEVFGRDNVHVMLYRRPAPRRRGHRSAACSSSWASIRLLPRRRPTPTRTAASARRSCSA